MRRLLACVSLALAGTVLAACGSTGKGVGAAASGAKRVADGQSAGAPAPRESLAAPSSGDGDGDSPEQTAFDSDDFHSMHFGHAADAADRQTITAIVERYYSALARQDGAKVCSMLLEVVAESLPEGEGQSAPVGRTGASHTSCAAAASTVLAESHRALTAEDRTLRVIGVRVRRRRASALLRFGARTARHILLYKEGGRWKLGTLGDEDLG